MEEVLKEAETLVVDTYGDFVPYTHEEEDDDEDVEFDEDVDDEQRQQQQQQHRQQHSQGVQPQVHLKGGAGNSGRGGHASQEGGYSSPSGAWGRGTGGTEHVNTARARERVAV